MGFFVLSRQSERLFRNFYAALCVYKDGSSGAKSCPEPPGRGGGGESSRPALNGAGRSLEESCSRWSVLEQRNATRLKFYPVCCNDVAWSTPAPHHRPRRQPKTQRFRTDQMNLSQLSSILCPSPSPARTFSFSTHSLRVLSTPLPLSGCRVSLSSCHTGPPTLTHGGREGEKN